MNIKFNMRCVPRFKRRDETLLEMIGENTANLQDRKWKRALCVHEAAHAEYAERYGSEPAVFEAPLAFIYDESDGSFTLKEAQVWVDVPHYWRDDLKQMLAAGVVERALMPGFQSEDEALGSTSEGGDYVYVLAALKRGRVPKSQHVKVLKQVRREIQRDLRNPAFRKVILQRAKSYQRILEKAIAKRRKAA